VKLIIFHFVTVEMLYRIVLDSTSIFRYSPDITSHVFYVFGIITGIHL